MKRLLVARRQPACLTSILARLHSAQFYSKAGSPTAVSTKIPGLKADTSSYQPTKAIDAIRDTDHDRHASP